VLSELSPAATRRSITEVTLARLWEPQEFMGHSRSVLRWQRTVLAVASAEPVSEAAALAARKQIPVNESHLRARECVSGGRHVRVTPVEYGGDRSSGIDQQVVREQIAVGEYRLAVAGPPRKP
jgi:hypothetical protein